ncbi:ABC transporter ATP-binding protein [Methanosarcinales archaeon]|nr:MAG: ABC transporter ATP-binding protein [Methanosarcinales archaeon]
MIEVRELRKEYGKFVAVEGLDFTVEKGEIFGIVGPNGAGKTTTLKMISTLIQPTSGKVRIGGFDAIDDEIEVRKRLGFLPEESPLYENMTIDGYLLFFSELYGLEPQDALLKIDKLLSMLNLENNGKRLGNLSKGMKRKVVIARSLLNDPDVLIYDEPTSGLDPMTSKQIIDFIYEMKQEEKTIVFSAHNLYQVEKICDRILIMKNGRSVVIGTVDEIRKRWGEESYFVEFVSANPPQGDLWRENGHYKMKCRGSHEMNDVTRFILEHGGEILRITPYESSLEEIFIRVVE